MTKNYELPFEEKENVIKQFQDDYTFASDMLCGTIHGFVPTAEMIILMS